MPPPPPGPGFSTSSPTSAFRSSNATGPATRPARRPSPDTGPEGAGIRDLRHDAFRRIIFDEDAFRTDCHDTKGCAAHARKVLHGKGITAGQMRNVMSALIRARDAGEGDSESCRVAGGVMTTYLERIEAGEDEGEAGKGKALNGLGFVPNWVDALIYSDFACHGPKNGRLEDMFLPGCTDKAAILRRGIAGRMSPDFLGARGYHSFVCLTSGNTETCATSCEMGTAAHCR